MAQVSKYLLDKDVEARIFEVFFQTLANLTTSSQVKEFLFDLLSPTERTMLSKRLAIAVMLEKGYSYEEIKDVLKVSGGTIQKISNWLKYEGKAFRKVAKKLLPREKVGVTTSSFDSVFSQIFAYKRKGKKPTYTKTPYPF